MPKLVTRPPKYARHKASGQAVVKVGKILHYLGPHGSAESKVAYQEVVSQWIADSGCSPSVASAIRLPQSDVTVTEMLAEYMDHAQAYYVKAGEATSQVHVMRSVVRFWKESFGSLFVRKIKPSHLKAIQKRMVTDGESRSYVNKITSYSKGIFRWAVETDLAQPEVWQGLLAVRGLAKGRTSARETEPISPVEDAVVDATIPHLPDVVSDMVRFQRATGARPGEVCGIRPCDVDQSGDVWLYRPASHKTEHHHRGRIVAIGPRGQDVLRPYLLRAPDACCFSPRESACRRHAVQREEWETPVQPSQAARKPKRKPRRSAKEWYSKDSYNRAVVRAVEVANKDRQRDCLPSLPTWHPNQLRHSVGSEVRQRFGLEAAQCVLGHAKANTTEIYAERDLSKAMEVARAIG